MEINCDLLVVSGGDGDSVLNVTVETGPATCELATMMDSLVCLITVCLVGRTGAD